MKAALTIILLLLLLPLGAVLKNAPYRYGQQQNSIREDVAALLTKIGGLFRTKNKHK